jgi:hypothetical protein
MAEKDCIIINDDAIVNAVHGGDYTLYKKELKPLYKSIENHILATAIAMNKNVVIDRGLNNTRQSRARWISIAHSLDTKITAVEFPFLTPERHAQLRYNSDGRGYSYEFWLNAAKRHFSEYQHATYEEGFDKIWKL